MTVTKQQQLEWLALSFDEWPMFGFFDINMSSAYVGEVGRAASEIHVITREEWQQERDKMQKQQDNSWHERGELPPVGVVCEVLNNDLYNPAWEKCTIIFMGEYKCIYSSEAGSEVVGDVYSTGAIEFRPLRTEREKAIDEMISVTLAVINQDTQRQMFGMLYDAGYRKVSQ